MLIFSRDLYRKIITFCSLNNAKHQFPKRNKRLNIFSPGLGFIFCFQICRQRKSLEITQLCKKKKMDNFCSIFLRCSTSDIYCWVHRADIDERAFAERKSPAKTTKTSKPKPQNTFWTPVLSITCTLANTRGNQFRGKIKFHISLRY